jgi:hypothetical protein
MSKSRAGMKELLVSERVFPAARSLNPNSKAVTGGAEEAASWLAKKRASPGVEAVLPGPIHAVGGLEP